MLDVGLLMPAVTGLEIDANPATQHIIHLELEVVGVVAARAAAGLPGPDDVCEDLALGGGDNAQVPILEVAAKTGLPFR